MTRSPFIVPHDIPFRAASAAWKIDDATMAGLFLCTANDALHEDQPSPVMLVEAMAQIAGALVFTDSSEPAFLSAISDVRFSEVPSPGDRIELRVTLETAFGGVFRFLGTAVREGLEFGSARFYLAKQERD